MVRIQLDGSFGINHCSGSLRRWRVEIFGNGGLVVSFMEVLLEDLPDVPLLMIFRTLRPKDLCSLCLCCSRFNFLISDSVWKDVTRSLYSKQICQYICDRESSWKEKLKRLVLNVQVCLSLSFSLSLSLSLVSTQIYSEGLNIGPTDWGVETAPEDRGRGQLGRFDSIPGFISTRAVCKVSVLFVRVSSHDFGEGFCWRISLICSGYLWKCFSLWS